MPSYINDANFVHLEEDFIEEGKLFWNKRGTYIYGSFIQLLSYIVAENIKL